jgi:predicted 2-oxoglutarate/Fe(II)-dependent dioxygenase YbiX
MKVLSLDEYYSQISNEITDQFSEDNLKVLVELALECNEKNHSDTIGANLKQITHNRETKILMNRFCDETHKSPLFFENNLPIDCERPCLSNYKYMNLFIAGQIMAFSKMVYHNLSQEELEEIYIHYCLEPLVEVFDNKEIVIRELYLYINRIVKCIYKQNSVQVYQVSEKEGL